jgi:hypothetical protein
MHVLYEEDTCTLQKAHIHLRRILLFQVIYCIADQWTIKPKP